MFGFIVVNSCFVVEKKINNLFRFLLYNIKIKYYFYNLGFVFYSFGCEFFGFVIIMGLVCLFNI